jgi:acyl-coenzyme A thioesterase PaaI-like protein
MRAPARVDSIIGLRRQEVGDVIVGHVPLVPHTRNAAGGLRSGVLLGAVDATGGMACGLASLPAWTVSTSLMAVIATQRHAGPLRFDARVLRASRTRVVASVDVRDEGNHDAAVAHAILTTAVLDPAAGPPPLSRPVLVEPAPSDVVDLEESFGIAPGRGTTTTLELERHLRNRWGILHGGALAVLVDVAASRAAGGGAIANVVLHFLAPARQGPLDARCEVRGEHVTVSVHDTGQQDRRVALASATVVPVALAELPGGPVDGAGAPPPS